MKFKRTVKNILNYVYMFLMISTNLRKKYVRLIKALNSLKSEINLKIYRIFHILRSLSKTIYLRETQEL